MGAYESGQNFADQFRIAAVIGRDLPEFCVTRGLDVRPMAEALGLSVEAFDDFQASVSLDRFCRLLEALAAISGDDTFGLHYAEAYGQGGVGPYGYGARNAATVMDALSFMIEFMGTIVDMETISMETGSHGATVTWTYSPTIVVRDQFADLAACLSLKQLWFCAGRQFLVDSARFERRAPRSSALHRRLFSPRLIFDARVNVISLPADVLRLVNEAADPHLFEVMSAQCQEIIAKRADSRNVITRLRRDLAAHLEGGNVDIANVARRLGLSDRSLQRRLAKLGTSYHKEHEALREEISRRMLRETKMPLAEIARRLGYSSQSAFTRAAIRWHGKSPSAVRAEALD